jgi:hypothetical protein
MEDLQFQLGEDKGDGRQHVTYLHGDAKYPDCFHTDSGYERKESVTRALRALKMRTKNVEALEAQLAQLIADATTSPCRLPRRCPLRELVAQHPAMRPIVIDGLLRVGETMNLIAPTKRGKSWLAYSLALSVADGRDWLDTFRCVAGPVLILDAELHEEVLSHRIPAVAEAMQILPKKYQDRIDVVPLRGTGIDLLRLGPLIRSIDPGYYALVILDAWYRFLPVGFSENDNAQVMQLYNAIDAYAAHLESAWMNIHHASKGDQANKSITDVGSGAGSQSRAADTHVIIRPHEEDDVSVIEAAVRSFPPVAPIAVRWNFPLWELDGADPRKLKGLQTKNTAQEKNARLEKDRQTIVNAMVRIAEPETKTFIRDLAGLGNPHFGFAWTSLIADKTITAVGRTKKGNGQQYDIFALSVGKDASG